jgi:membrane protease YdiL (CAAX protease family)
MLGMCAGLMLHVLPGFNNPQVLSGVVLSPGGAPYTKYLNVDKLIAGLFLLTTYVRRTARSERFERPERSERSERLRGFTWRFAVVVGVVTVLSLAFGFVRWDPKLPYWFPLWAAALMVFTVMPEEALFRGVVQTSVARWLGSTRRAELTAMVIAGTLFGVAHLAGGALYVLLATVAGVGYGWIFLRTRSIAAAIAAHTGVNMVHFLFFTYPALALHSWRW